jgi:pyrimidine-specific ribonucleoside hydrolase
VDNLFGLSLPEGVNPATTSSAVELLIASIQSSPEKISLLTLGPLTNVAEALQAAPSLTSSVEMIYVMGGAVEVAGNVGASGVGIENDVAEWNMYVDPHAAAIVVGAGAPVTLIPLDATNHAPVTLDFYHRLQRDHATPEAAFVYDMLTRQRDFIESGGYYFWDPLAAAILTDESLATIETRRLTVVEAEGPESGRTQIGENGAAVRVAVSADGARFEQIFLDALNAP